MSGAQTLVEIVVSLPRAARAAWRETAPARALAVLGTVPPSEGRLELIESDATIEARAFFSEEAEPRAELLIDAFRATAEHGARGSGTHLLLVDFQHQEGHTLTIGDGTSGLMKLPARKARARHPTLDGFMEACLRGEEPPPPPLPGPLGVALATALEALRDRPRHEVLAGWARVREVSATPAHHSGSKADEKRLLAVVAGESEPRWPWARLLPLRLQAQLAPGTLDDAVIAGLDDVALSPEDRDMLLDSLGPSTADRALSVLVAELDRGGRSANVARRALAFSAHPRATEVLIERAGAWLARTVEHPERLPQGADGEAHGVYGMLQLRRDARCRAMLHTIWLHLHAVRGRTPPGSEGTAALAARIYIETSLCDVDAGAAAPVRAAFPGPRSPIDAWAEPVAILHGVVPPPTER